MSFPEPHEMHLRRAGRNKAVLLCLVALIALLFALTVVKILDGQSMEAFDHAPRPSLTVEEGN